MNAAECAKLLVAVGAVEVRTDPATWFTWSSGERAPIYCDNRIVISYPDARARIAAALAESIRRNFPEVQVVAGTSTAGIPHAAWVADLLELPMVYVRGSAKEHGKGKRVEGRALRGERVVVVEDAVSFGGSSLTAVDGVNAEGGVVIGVQAIFEYGFPKARARFQEAGVTLRALTTFDDLVGTLELPPATREALLAWRAR